MNKLLSTLAILSVVVLAGCSATTRNTMTPVERAPIIAPQVVPVTMLPVQWKVLNKAELEKLLIELNANPDPKFTLMALTPTGFSNLALNMDELKRFMREQNEVIYYYSVVTSTP